MGSLYGQGIKDPNSINTPRAKYANQAIRSNVNRFTLSNAQVVGDKLYLGKIPASAIFKSSSTVIHDALGASVTLDIGFDGLAPVGAPNCLASALAVGGAAGTKSGVAAVSLANMDKAAWQLAGLTSNPGGELTLVATIKGATVAATPNIYFSFDFVDER